MFYLYLFYLGIGVTPYASILNDLGNRIVNRSGTSVHKLISEGGTGFANKILDLSSAVKKHHLVKT